MDPSATPPSSPRCIAPDPGRKDQLRLNADSGSCFLARFFGDGVQLVLWLACYRFLKPSAVHTGHDPYPNTCALRSNGQRILAHLCRQGQTGCVHFGMLELTVWQMARLHTLASAHRGSCLALPLPTRRGKLSNSRQDAQSASQTVQV